MSTKKVKYGLKEMEKDYGTLTFGRLLSAHRLSEEYSQTEMAEKLGISRQSLCDLEKGRKIPSASRAAKIATALDMSPKSFIELALRDHLREENLNYDVSITAKKAS